MSKRIIRVVLCALLFALGFPAQAQQPKKIPRIGYLSASSASFQSFRVEAFRQGLRELGYVEGKNIVIEYRYAEGKPDRLPDLASELVRLKLDVIFTGVIVLGQTEFITMVNLAGMFTSNVNSDVCSWSFASAA